MPDGHHRLERKVEASHEPLDAVAGVVAVIVGQADVVDQRKGERKAEIGRQVEEDEHEEDAVDPRIDERMKPVFQVKGARNAAR